MDHPRYKQLKFLSVLELRQHILDVIILLLTLAIFQPSKCAYRIVSMRDTCALGQAFRHELRLSASGVNSAASIIFDSKQREFEAGTCAIDLVTVTTHVISLHLVTATPTSTPSSVQDGQSYRSPCTLSMFSAGKNGKVSRLLQSVDLCSGGVATLSELYSRHHVTAIWSPPHSNYSENIQASELVVTAVGIGPTVCNKHANDIHLYFPCGRQYGRPPLYCIATDLLCDGRRNCPMGVEDEDPELCGTRHPLVDVQNVSVRSNRQNKMDNDKMVVLSDDKNKMAIMLEDSNKTEGISRASVEVSKIREFIIANRTRNTTLASRGKKNSKRNRATFPEALAHYGPWGYLMLGMLISGTVLMICGIWECCCRNHKHSRSPPSTPPSPIDDLFIVIPGVRCEEATSPPAYDDLDQPPAYNVLFPTSRKQEQSEVHEESTDGASIAQSS